MAHVTPMRMNTWSPLRQTYASFAVVTLGQTCASCKSTSSPNTEAEDKCRTKYSEAKSLASSGLLDQAVCRLRECLKEREAVLYRYNQELANTRDLLARCLADEANFTEAALHVRFVGMICLSVPEYRIRASQGTSFFFI